MAKYIVQEIQWSKITVTELPSDLLKIAPAPWANTPIQEPYVAPKNLGPIAPYGNPLPTSGNNSSSGNQTVDPYPPNVPAPNRTCPQSEGNKSSLYGASMTCVKGIWTLDPGQTIVVPTSP